MKRVILVSILLISLWLIPSNLKSQNYVGIGATYLNPISDLSNVNSSSTGFNFIWQSRKYCKYWLGVRVDYASLDTVEGILSSANYYKSLFSFSPEFRYNFIKDNCENYELTPYAIASLPISIIEDKNETLPIGIGIGVGAGLAYSFNFINKCWMIDLNMQYSDKNSIYRDEGRLSFTTINASLNLSVRL
jgi:hypothetical protein